MKMVQHNITKAIFRVVSEQPKTIYMICIEPGSLKFLKPGDKQKTSPILLRVSYTEIMNNYEIFTTDFSIVIMASTIAEAIEKLRKSEAQEGLPEKEIIAVINCKYSNSFLKNKPHG